MRDLPDRRQSVQVVFDYMWRLLSPVEQAILAKAWIFLGEFSRDAVMVVTGATLPDLSGLVDRALIRFVRPGWFVYHNLIRQFAAQELGRQPEQHMQIKQAYQAYYTKFMQDRGTRLESPEQPRVFREINQQIDNIRHTCY